MDATSVTGDRKFAHEFIAGYAMKGGQFPALLMMSTKDFTALADDDISYIRHYNCHPVPVPGLDATYLLPVTKVLESTYEWLATVDLLSRLADLQQDLPDAEAKALDGVAQEWAASYDDDFQWESLARYVEENTWLI